jgi:hypothetical protein
LRQAERARLGARVVAVARTIAPVRIIETIGGGSHKFDRHPYGRFGLIACGLLAKRPLALTWYEVRKDIPSERRDDRLGDDCLELGCIKSTFRGLLEFDWLPHKENRARTLVSPEIAGFSASETLTTRTYRADRHVDVVPRPTVPIRNAIPSAAQGCQATQHGDLYR